MSIHSNAFGGIVLTGEDAKKFRNQVTYGRPKAAAHENVRAGVKLVEELRSNGSIRLQVKEPA